MATRSTIALLQDDGQVRAIYCHWDGGLKSNGVKLLEWYGNIDKVADLIALGSISYLAEKVAPEDDEPHHFKKAQDGVVVAYHRDRGEHFQQYEFDSLIDYIKNLIQQEYNYIMIAGHWFLYEDGTLKLLEDLV